MRRFLLLPILSLALLSGDLASGQGVIEGKVELRKPGNAPVLNQRYQGAADPSVLVPDPPAAVVYLEGEFPAPKGPLKAQMAQKNLAFVTPLLPVLVGTTVEFPNLDETYHNIFSYSKPKRFDLGRYRSEERPIPSQVFDKPGPVALHCDIHEHMFGIILVLTTPHFARTDAEGRYRLTNLPPGRYVLKAWINSKTTLEKPVEVKAGGTLHLDFP